MIKGLTPQEIIQGKSYSLNLSFSAEDLEKITKIWFTSVKLGICKEMDFFNGVYSLTLSFEETQNLAAGFATFNITVKLVGEVEKRDLVNAVPLTVIRNENPVCCEE